MPISLSDFAPESANRIQQSMKQKVDATISLADFAPQSRQNIQSALNSMKNTVQDAGEVAKSSATTVGKAISRSPYYQMAIDAAKKYGIDPNLFARQINQESGFNPNAQSPAGAQGIAQIVPKYHPGVDPFDPQAALDYSARLMSNHLKNYGSYERALSAYNSGRPDAYLDPNFGHGETANYVRAIMGGKDVNPKLLGNYTPSNYKPLQMQYVKGYDTSQISKPGVIANPDGTLQLAPQDNRNYMAEWQAANAGLQNRLAQQEATAKSKVTIPEMSPPEDNGMDLVKQAIGQNFPEPQPVQSPQSHETNFGGDLYNNFLNAMSGFHEDQLVKQSGHGVGANLGSLLGQGAEIGLGVLAGGTIGSVVPGVGTVAMAGTGGAAAGALAARAQEAQRERMMNEKPDPAKQMSAGAIGLAMQLLPVFRGSNLAESAVKNSAVQAGLAGLADVAQQGMEQNTATPKIDWGRVTQAAGVGAASGGVAGITAHTGVLGHAVNDQSSANDASGASSNATDNTDFHPLIKPQEDITDPPNFHTPEEGQVLQMDQQSVGPQKLSLDKKALMAVNQKTGTTNTAEVQGGFGNERQFDKSFVNQEHKSASLDNTNRLNYKGDTLYAFTRPIAKISGKELQISPMQAGSSTGEHAFNVAEAAPTMPRQTNANIPNNYFSLENAPKTVNLQMDKQVQLGGDNGFRPQEASGLDSITAPHMHEIQGQGIREGVVTPDNIRGTGNVSTLASLIEHPEIAPTVKNHLQEIANAPSIDRSHIAKLKQLLSDTKQLRVLCNLFGLV